MMIDTSSWGWPQWTYLILIVLSLLINAGEHGKPREPTNAFLSFLTAGIALFLLISGGYFS